MVGVKTVGARSPLGLDALQTAMAVRAGLLEPRSTDLLDKRKNRIGCVRARWLADDLFGVERWLELAGPALAEAAAGSTEKLPLWLALPEEGRPDDDRRIASLIAELGHAADVPIDLDRSGTVRGGQAAYVAALEQAEAAIAEGAPAALVGAIESYYHPDVLRWLDEACRLHAPRAMDGFVPGEGAAFALLTAGDAPSSITRVAHGIETSVPAGEPNLAQAMTALVHDALPLAMPEDDGATWVMSDLNGESHRLSEWEKVAIRCALRGDRVVHQRVPGDLGDVGAATGALMLAVAHTFWRCACAPRPRALFALHSEGGQRGVIVAQQRGAA